MGRADELLEELGQILAPDQKDKCGVSGCDELSEGWTEVIHVSAVMRVRRGQKLGRSVNIPICGKHTDKMSGFDAR